MRARGWADRERLAATAALTSVCLWPAAWLLGVGTIAYPFRLAKVEPRVATGPEGWESLGARWRAPTRDPALEPVDVERLRSRAAALTRTIRYRNAREITAGAAVFVCGAVCAIDRRHLRRRARALARTRRRRA